MKCVFCKIPKKNYLFENEHFFVIADKYPVAKGHHLVILKQHKKDYFELDDSESAALTRICQEVKQCLDERYHPTGYNLAMNCGKSAGQSIFHFHLHIIPRY